MTPLRSIGFLAALLAAVALSPLAARPALAQGCPLYQIGTVVPGNALKFSDNCTAVDSGVPLPGVLKLETADPNTVFAGPASGGIGATSMRKIVNADITDATIAAAKLIGTDITTVGALVAGSINWSGNITTSGNVTGAKVIAAPTTAIPGVDVEATGVDAKVKINAVTGNFQSGVDLYSAGTLKWALLRAVDETFHLVDYANGGASVFKVEAGDVTFGETGHSTAIVSKAHITDTTASTSTATGSFVTDGGAGIAGDIFGGKFVNLPDGGAGGTLGGVKINARNALLGNALILGLCTDAAWTACGIGNGTAVIGLNAPVQIAFNTAVTDTTDSTSTTSGSLRTAGGAGIVGRLNVGGRVTATGAYNQFGSTTPSHIASGQTAPPALTSCGTGSPTNAGGTDTAGTIVMGTNATGCIVTFTTPYTGVPFCTVTWHGTPLASQSYTRDNAKITLTQTSTSGNQATYNCVAPAGG